MTVLPRLSSVAFALVVTATLVGCGSDSAMDSSHAMHLSKPASVFLKAMGLTTSDPVSSTAPITWSTLAMSTPA